jgi:GTP cyclohydrolase II
MIANDEDGMTIGPTEKERLARARADLRIGLPIVLGAGDAGLLVMASELVTAERLADFRAIGQPYVAITARRAEVLRTPAYDTDMARLYLPMDGDVAWVKGMADPADDLNTPMKGPFLSLRDGKAALARQALTQLKTARLLPSAIGVEVSEPLEFAAKNGLTIISGLQKDQTPTLSRIVSAKVPLEVSEAGRLHVFRLNDSGEEHYAIEIGRPSRDQPVLTRLHSACFTGDLLGSLKCDCGPQLKAALAQMGQEGSGVLLYLNQEGRGIGLTNKMRAYSLQDQGFDTVEANHRLGFEDDERDFRIGAEILKNMGFSKARLLTNNPAKVSMMERSGIAVTERVPLHVGLNPLNAKYLNTKAKKSGHIL